MVPTLLASMNDPTAEDIVKIVAISGGMFIAVIAILSSAIAGMVRHGQREKSRRDVAAFVAEGSMTADEGERLLNAGKKGPWPCDKV